MRRITPIHIALGVAGLVILILAIMLVRAGKPDSTAAGSSTESNVRGDPNQKRCASQATYDRIKRELFRRAAVTRGGGQEMFDRLSAYASVRVEKPLLTGTDAQLGTLRCSGRLSVDLPPGTQVAGGRGTLTADIDYVLQPAADGSGDVVLLEGADPIVIPLATVARSGETAPPPVTAAPSPMIPSAPYGQPAPPSATPVPVQPVPAPPPVARPPAPSPQRAATTARPSFNCRYARTRSEIAVCSDAGLAALDRSMASEFYRALAAADSGKRRQLTVTRDLFLRHRNNCGSDACIADAYRGRIAEIRDIMARP